MRGREKADLLSLGIQTEAPRNPTKSENPFSCLQKKSKNNQYLSDLRSNGKVFSIIFVKISKVKVIQHQTISPQFSLKQEFVLVLSPGNYVSSFDSKYRTLADCSFRAFYLLCGKVFRGNWNCILRLLHLWEVITMWKTQALWVELQGQSSEKLDVVVKSYDKQWVMTNFIRSNSEESRSLVLHESSAILLEVEYNSLPTSLFMFIWQKSSASSRGVSGEGERVDVLVNPKKMAQSNGSTAKKQSLLLVLPQPVIWYYKQLKQVKLSRKTGRARKGLFTYPLISPFIYKYLLVHLFQAVVLVETCVCEHCCDYILAVNMSFKDAVITGHAISAPSKSNPNLGNESHTQIESLSAHSMPPNTSNSIPQVQKDTEDLSNTCLFGKVLGSPVELKTIISKTKLDWKVIKGDVDYLEMGNGWILMRFANPNDRFLIWNERPWHVLGQVFVLKEWEPMFDPFSEEIEWADVWVRIPRVPAEMMNHACIDKLLSCNNVGKLIKLDQRSFLRNKIRFVRACVSVNIVEPLISYAEMLCSDGKVHGFLIWYEDFSEGCSFCGDTSHVIDVCPPLNPPHKEVQVTIKKAPVKMLGKRSESVNFREVDSEANLSNNAYTISLKPRQKPVNVGGSMSKNWNEDELKKKKEVAETNLKSRQDQSNYEQSKNKAKVRMVNHNGQVSSSNDEKGCNESDIPEVPTPHPKQKISNLSKVTNEFAPSRAPNGEGQVSSYPRQLTIAAQMIEKQIMNDFDDDLHFDFEEHLNEAGTFLAKSPNESDGLLSASSEQSIVRQIRDMEVEQPFDQEGSENSSLAKKRGGADEKELTVSSSLKRKKKEPSSTSPRIDE